MSRLLSQFWALPVGLKIVIGVILIFAGRCLWLYVQRPAHEREIAAAYGSVGLFYGAPQTDSTGNRVTFVETSDKGYGIFLVDTATAKKTLVCEEDGSGRWRDSFNLRVWPWGPDDSSFIYSDGSQIRICDPETGKSIAEIKTPEDIAVLAWLTPTAFVYVDPTGKLYQVEREVNGTWAQKSITESPNHFALRNVGKSIKVSASGVIRGADASKAYDGSLETIWISGKSNDPVWLQIAFEGPAWAITQYKLASAQNDPGANPSNWQLLGSDDGIQWTVLDKQTNQKFNSLAGTNEYRISNQTPYWFYRLNITASAGGGSKVCLAKFQLLSENTPDTVSADAENDPNESAAKAFDYLPTTRWFNNFAPLPSWLQYQFGGGAGWALFRYALTSANDAPPRDPQDWQFQASNDGTNWTTIDTRSGEIFPARFQCKTYSFANSTPYRFYRLYITARQGDARGRDPGGVQLAEFNLGLTTSNSIYTGLDPLANAFCLTTLSRDTIAWAQNNCIWSMNLVSGTPRLLLNLQNAMPTTTSLHGFSYSKQTGQFLLSCNENGVDSLWSFDINNPLFGLRQVPAAAAVENGAWISASQGGWVGQKDNNLFAQIGSSSKPHKLLPSANNVDAFTVSPDGRRIFILGTIKNEVSSGVWQYDIASAKLRCVAPDSDYPSPYAMHEKHTHDSIQLPFGRTLDYDLFSPVDSSRQSHGGLWHHKYPLVIGNTDFGVVVRGGHGRLWIPAMTACDAYVVVINRDGDWWNGIEKWGDNVTAVYNQLANTLPIDKKRVFLFAVSAEASYVNQLVETNPAPWRGIIYLNPAGQLPDFSKSPAFERRPMILLSAGGLEREDELFKQYQEQALKSGALLDYFISPGEGHHFVGNLSQLQRTKAMVHFVFDQ